MKNKTDKTILKITLGVLVVAILAISTFLVTALTTKNSNDAILSESQLSKKGTTINVNAKEVEDEEGLDEDDLTAREIASLKTEITEKEAIQIALSKVNGEVTDVEFEKKMGHEVYSVEIDDNGDEVDVYVDIKTGEVVGTERDSEETEDDDN